MKGIWIAALMLCACSANWHSRRAERHLLKAEMKGAEVKADTIYKIHVRPAINMHTTLKNTFIKDTLIVEKDGATTRVVIQKCEDGIADVSIDSRCPPDTLRVPQIIYRTIKTGKTFWNFAPYFLLVFIAGAVVAGAIWLFFKLKL